MVRARGSDRAWWDAVPKLAFWECDISLDLGVSRPMGLAGSPKSELQAIATLLLGPGTQVSPPLLPGALPPGEPGHWWRVCQGDVPEHGLAVSGPPPGFVEPGS